MHRRRKTVNGEYCSSVGLGCMRKLYAWAVCVRERILLNWYVGSTNGEVSERFKEHAWKACVGEILPWVQIPPSPPYYPRKTINRAFPLRLPPQLRRAVGQLSSDTLKRILQIAIGPTPMGCVYLPSDAVVGTTRSAEGNP